MDYKYIEQLLERYWKAETSLEEEQILHTFFCQSDIPAHLKKYRHIFNFGHIEKEKNLLNDEFDSKLLDLTKQEEHVKAHKITITYRLRPLFKAAAVVAILLTLGIAAQEPYYSDKSNEEEASTYNSSIAAASDSSEIDTTNYVMPTATILKN